MRTGIHLSQSLFVNDERHLQQNRFHYRKGNWIDPGVRILYDKATPEVPGIHTARTPRLHKAPRSEYRERIENTGR